MRPFSKPVHLPVARLPVHGCLCIIWLGRLSLSVQSTALRGGGSASDRSKRLMLQFLALAATPTALCSVVVVVATTRLLHSKMELRIKTEEEKEQERAAEKMQAIQRGNAARAPRPGGSLRRHPSGPASRRMKRRR